MYIYSSWTRFQGQQKVFVIHFNFGLEACQPHSLPACHILDSSVFAIIIMWAQNPFLADNSLWGPRAGQASEFLGWHLRKRPPTPKIKHNTTKKKKVIQFKRLACIFFGSPTAAVSFFYSEQLLLKF